MCCFSSGCLNLLTIFAPKACSKLGQRLTEYCSWRDSFLVRLKAQCGREALGGNPAARAEKRQILQVHCHKKWINEPLSSG